MKNYEATGVTIEATLVDGWETNSDGIAIIYGTDGETYQMPGQRFGGDDGVVCRIDDRMFWLPPQVFEDLFIEVPEA